MRPKAKRVQVKGAEAPELPAFSRPKPSIVAAQIIARAQTAGFRWQLPKARRYVITAAQNDAKINEPFFRTLQTYCRMREAELVVLPFRYRNPTTKRQDKDTSISQWAAELHPYLFAGRQALNENLHLFGDLKIQPTRQSPLSGMTALSGAQSAIFGHVKLELTTVPTPAHALPKLLTTTGAVTEPTYVDAVAGKIAEFHHAHAAVVVEIKDEKIFHLRQLNAKEDGSFIDLITRYTVDGAESAERALALVLGDTHVGHVDPGVEKATFGARGMVEVLRPQHVVYHDLFDGYSVNPHHKNDPFRAALKQKFALNKVREEIAEACQYVKDRTPLSAIAVLVPSNHNDFLARWMRETNWQWLDDFGSKLLYLDTAAELLRAGQQRGGEVDYPSPFELWASSYLPRAKVLSRGESFPLAGVELAVHGDKGPNGSRGSAKNLRRIGVKSIIGHSHSPQISEGCYQTGTSSLLKLEYNQDGPSSWMHTHCVLYANGKRALLNIVGEEWRL